MPEVFVGALRETLWMFPLLLAVYVIIEFIELKYGNAINDKIEKTAGAAPLLGALLGCLPQCGFSVLSSALYCRGLITTGTLLAVYLSTSDEAIPIILAHPDKISVLAPIISVKLVVAVTAGYSVDYFIKIFGLSGRKIETAAAADCSGESCGHAHVNSIQEKGCCGHRFSTEKIRVKDLLVHPFFHTLKISVFIFAVSLAVNYTISRIGGGNLYGFLLGNTALQPVAAALIGLIPNCAASVAITEIYLRGGLDFGSVIAGLCASAGLGMLVLFKENKSKKDSMKIVLLLFVISIAAGFIAGRYCAFGAGLCFRH